MDARTWLSMALWALTLPISWPLTVVGNALAARAYRRAHDDAARQPPAPWSDEPARRAVLHIREERTMASGAEEVGRVLVVELADGSRLARRGDDVAPLLAELQARGVPVRERISTKSGSLSCIAWILWAPMTAAWIALALALGTGSAGAWIFFGAAIAACVIVFRM